MGVPVLLGASTDAAAQRAREVATARAVLNEVFATSTSYAAPPWRETIRRPTLRPERPQAPPPAPASAFRPVPLPTRSLSPPPLEEASDLDLESEHGWDDVPAPRSDSPTSQQGLGEPCPWGPSANHFVMQDAASLPSPRVVLRPSAFRTSFLSARTETLWTSGGGRAPRRSGLTPSRPAVLPLEAELASLAGKVAHLVHAHADADAQVRAGMQDVANQLAALASALQVGLPLRA